MDDFEAHRPHLRAVAYRMLGSTAEADDAVQEAWLRLARTGPDDVRDTRAWLTTVVARVCLDMLRSRTARREVALEPPESAGTAPGPEQEAVLADSVGVALLVVLDTLSPAERLAFVLHDTFSVPFDRIAAILGRSVPATKMLASRARRHVRAARTVGARSVDAARSPDADLSRRWRVVEAFLAASRQGDFAALLDLLDPDVSARADAAASPTGHPTVVTGAEQVGRQALAFGRRARHARVDLVAGAPAIVVAPRGRLALVLTFTFAGGRIAGIDIATVEGPRRRSAVEK